MINRTIQTATSEVQMLGSPEGDIAIWLSQQMRHHRLRWLLAHCDDGVVWGEMRGDELVTSGTVFSRMPLLRAITLQRCRAFGVAGELLLRRSDDGFVASLRCDGGAGDAIRYLNETQLLWGDDAAEHSSGFTLVREGSRGIMQALPLDFTPTTRRRAMLQVRRYLMTDGASGLVRVCASRLVELSEGDV